MLSPDKKKRCPRCGEDKLAEDNFYRVSRTTGDGYSGYCKTCLKQKAVEWQKTNPEKKAASDKKQAQRPERKKTQAAANKRWAAANRDKRRGYEKRYYDNNRDHVLVRNNNRKAKALGYPGNGVSLDEWLAARAAWNEACAYCVEQSGDEMDHFIPLTLGGEHSPANVLPTCRSCNASKHSRHPLQWPGTNPSQLDKIRVYLLSLDADVTSRWPTPDPTDLTHKQCSACREKKPRDTDFYKAASKSDGLDAYCKSCRLNLSRPAALAYQNEKGCWTHRRRLVYERDRGTCQLCRASCLPTVWECDHIVPVKDGGGGQLDNLRVLCLDCHKKRTNTDMSEDVGGL